MSFDENKKYSTPDHSEKKSPGRPTLRWVNGLDNDTNQIASRN